MFPKLFPPYEDGVVRYDTHFLRYTRPGTSKVSVDAHLNSLIVKDPNTFGFDNRARNLNPTPLSLEVYDEIGGSIAEALVMGRKPDGSPLGALEMPCSENTVACGKTFVESYGKKFFRRPLTSEELNRYSKFFEDEFKVAEGVSGVEPFKAALALTIEAFLQAPQFLYRPEIGDPKTKAGGAIKLTQYEIASRLSYMLWSSMPDDELLLAAENGELASAEQREAQARRMLKDKNYRYQSVEFFRQWADFERIWSESYRRKPGRNLGDPAHPYEVFYTLGAREEIARFIEWAFAEGDGTVKTLFTSTKTWGNAHVRALYEGKALADYAPPSNDWKEFEPNATQRAGILTRPLVAWAYSHFDTPNPPVRGSFILSKVLCFHFPPPPGDAMALAGSVSLPAGSSNREQFVARLNAASNCKTCHNTMDPPGFAMENYNEIGMYIRNDAKNGKPINASGKLDVGSDADGDFTDLVQLTKRFGDSVSVRQCMTTQMYEYATGRDAEGSLIDGSEGVDNCRLEGLDKAVADSGGDLREALVKYAATDDFVWRAAY